MPESLYSLPATPGSEVGRFVKSTCEPSILRLPLPLILPTTVKAWWPGEGKVVVPTTTLLGKLPSSPIKVLLALTWPAATCTFWGEPP